VKLPISLRLAVSKIGRLTIQTREDITALAPWPHKVGAAGKRAREAASSFVGNLGSIETSIDFAWRIVKDAEQSR
jgi:hypothetical protein